MFRHQRIKGDNQSNNDQHGVNVPNMAPDKKKSTFFMSRRKSALKEVNDPALSIMFFMHV